MPDEICVAEKSTASTPLASNARTVSKPDIIAMHCFIKPLLTKITPLFYQGRFPLHDERKKRFFTHYTQLQVE